MSDLQETPASPDVSGTPGPEDLPPVQPPSAGFIMQLFLIPAIIVAVVIGVWVLFGKMAGTQKDWGQLVQDLGSENEHRRWRAASGLAHMLNADRERFKEMETMSVEQRATMGTAEPLAQNPRIAEELVSLFDKQLEKKSKDGEHVQYQNFLAKTLGSLDLPDKVLPSLQKATEPTYNSAVRSSALQSIAMILDRADRDERTIETLDELTATLIDSTAVDPAEEGASLIRQTATFALGMVGTDDSASHLVTLLASADEKTQVNAAIGLTRLDRTEGVEVFLDILEIAATETFDADAAAKLPDDERMQARSRYQIEIPMMLNNTLKALDQLAPKLTREEKTQIATRLKPLAKSYEQVQLKQMASDLTAKLN